MYQTGLLILTGSLRSVIGSISNYLATANEKILKRLYIKLEPELREPFLKSDRSKLSRLSRIAPIVYSRASIACKDLDVRLLLGAENKNANQISPFSFDIILTDSLQESCEITTYLNKVFGKSCNNILKLTEVIGTGDDESNSKYKEYNTYNIVILGGTFDQLHNGHKVLLSEAVMRATEKLIVGITDGVALERKTLYELIEPYQVRAEKVKDFLCDVDPSISYDVVPIYDPYGPSITDPDITCIVVSEETTRGGDAVNVERLKRNMKALDVHIVSLVEDTEDVIDDTKLSSTTLRKNLLGTLLQEPPMPLEGKKQICINLIGLPMSGKSCIARCLQLLGAEIISCDEALLQILNRDNAVQKKVLEVLAGEDVLSNGAVDYKKLTLALLKNKDQRQRFNMEISQKLQTLVLDKIKSANEAGTAKVIVISSSAIIETDWKDEANLTCATIIPVSEAIQRLKECYSIDEKDAASIISNVASNEDNIKVANIVFSNQWTPEFTGVQVKRSWSYLQDILKK